MRERERRGRRKDLFNFSSRAIEGLKKDLHDPDNHDGVITHTHLEPDILECEVKWALGSITSNKATGSDGFQLNNFKS